MDRILCTEKLIRQMGHSSRSTRIIQFRLPFFLLYIVLKNEVIIQCVFCCCCYFYFWVFDISSKFITIYKMVRFSVIPFESLSSQVSTIILKKQSSVMFLGCRHSKCCSCCCCCCGKSLIPFPANFALNFEL